MLTSKDQLFTIILDADGKPAEKLELILIDLPYEKECAQKTVPFVIKQNIRRIGKLSIRNISHSSKHNLHIQSK
jgi:hypothetical protein